MTELPITTKMSEKELSIEFTFEEERIIMGCNGFKQPNSEVKQRQLRGYAEKIREVLESTNTKTPVISENERLETLGTIGKQAHEWSDYVSTMPKITCTCGMAWTIHQMYKCFYCSIFFCKGCAFHHFEDDEH